MNKEWYRGKFPPSIMEAAALHSMLFTLGFSLAENVFITPSSEQGLLVILKKDNKEVVFRAGFLELSPPEIGRLWLELNTMWNTGGEMTKEEKDQIVLNSNIHNKKVDIIATILMKGLQITPRSDQQNVH